MNLSTFDNLSEDFFTVTSADFNSVAKSIKNAIDWCATISIIRKGSAQLSFGTDVFFVELKVMYSLLTVVFV